MKRTARLSQILRHTNRRSTLHSVRVADGARDERKRERRTVPSGVYYAVATRCDASFTLPFMVQVIVTFSAALILLKSHLLPNE